MPVMGEYARLFFGRIFCQAPFPSSHTFWIISNYMCTNNKEKDSKKVKEKYDTKKSKKEEEGR